MADYNIKAEITADASGFESGVKKAQKASKNLSKSLSGVIQGLGKSGLVGALGAVGLATGGVVTVLNTVTKVAKKVAQTIDECSQAYRTQYQAEIALATAVNNNPYVDGTATKRLKEFASEMQRVSDVGDEQLLPMMAQLVASGRTEEETMQIMSVALDMSASGAMSLDTAITQLNATLNGNVGRLGQQNAELKDLTEEELKQGKAVEILGAKYKGLAQTTADSQKQLKNAIGDLKENLGQVFETALAPMRRYFTEVITNLNNSITKSRELKSAMKEVFGGDDVNLEASTDALNIAFTEVLHKQQEVTKNYQQYIQLYGKYIDVATDETALSYKAQISDLNAQLKAISEELNKRRKESEEEKKRIAKEKSDAEAQTELEKQKEIREKELKLENEWADKLFAIRLENLEKTRERELENEELTQEQKEAIFDFYGKQILAMKIKQIEKERDEILGQENLTEEAKQTINLYYENKITNAKNDEEEKRLKIKKKSTEEEVKDEKRKFTEMIKIAGEYTKKFAETFKNVTKKIASTVKNVISGIGNIFTKLFDFNTDEALNNLLKFEDSVLTFFVETVPKLPAFFKSAIESIIKLINSLMATIDFEGIQNFIYSIIDTIIENAPKIVNQLLEVVINIAQSLLNGIFHFVENGGWQMFLNTLLNIQNKIQDFVINNIDKIVQTIIDMLPDLVQFLIDSVVSASQTLSKLIKPIVKLIVPLIEAIIDFLASDEIMDAFIDVVLSLVDAIVEELIPAIIKKLPKILTKIIKFIVSSSVKMTSAIVQGLVNAFVKTNWGEVIKQCFIGFIEAFKDLFGIHSPSTLFENFGQFMIEGLWKGIQDMGNWLNDKMGTFFSNMVSGVGNAFSNIGEGIKGAFENVWANIQSVFNNVGNWFYNIFSQASNGIRNAFNGIGEWFRNLWNGFANAMKTPINSVISGINEMITQMNKISVTIPSWVPAIGGRTFGINLSRLNYLATGTQNAQKGLAIVGEAGPELVKFNGGEQVLNNRNTNKALAEAGKSTNNFNVTFNNLQDTTAYAMMQQLKQYNRQMAINGVI